MASHSLRRSAIPRLVGLSSVSFRQIELAKVHAVVALGDRDEVAATDVSSVLDRFVVAQLFDFVVDVVEYLTEARPSKTRTGTLEVITSYSKFTYIHVNSNRDVRGEEDEEEEQE